jgi:serine/threonine protein kinase
MAAALRCPSCSDVVLETQRFCPHCGTLVGAQDAPTGTAPRPLARTPASPTPGSATPRSATPASGRAGSGIGVSRAPGSGPSRDRFSAGDLLLDRYRIVGLLGRGGMGEVYRADDLRLGQAVALKFLPEALQGDAERLERFYNEARMAREVSHPAVCRVHDIGDVDGHHFLSMEYVDGEDLASLVRRIGRLPGDKATDIAHQLCGGLAAAHAKGVLHRDLKPQNVMLDGRGKVRITDFGLAGLAETILGDEVRSGTPAYMSPEQLEGREVTVRSDVYALGLVLDEIYTGKRAYPGRSLVEIKRQHEAPLVPPSELVADVAPEAELTILRCLDAVPSRRPVSAMAVSALLPGGDPLAAVLAAGETPSPEMVAAAGRREAIRAWKAWACVGAIVLSIGGVFVLSSERSLLRRLPDVKSTQVLEDRAGALLHKISPSAPAADHAVSYGTDGDFLRWVGEQPRKSEQWDRIVTGEPAAVFFWYRQGPRPLVPLRESSEVLWNDPPLTTSGMSGVRVDLSGRLLSYYQTPPQLESEAAAAALPSPDWSMLFAEARLDPLAFKRVEPRWAPLFFCDTRVAWEGTYPQRPDIPLRVEAAAHRGQPVAFFLVGPWTTPERMDPIARKGREQAGQIIVSGLIVALLVSGGLLAWHHIRSGRGDRIGAFRLATLIAILNMAAWVLATHHVADREGEMELAARAAGEALLAAFILWVFYLALEPYVRRFWPHTIISWTRLLGGAVRDPLVGRDILAGAVWGTGLALLFCVSALLPEWLGQGTAAPVISYLDALLGPSRVLALLAVFPFFGIRLAVGALLILLLLKRLLRNERLAAWALGILLTVIQGLEQSRGPLPLWLAIPLAVVIMSSFTVLLLRFGLLSTAVGVTFVNGFLAMPLTTDLRSWSSGPTVIVLIASGALVAFAFRASQGTSVRVARPS